MANIAGFAVSVMSSGPVFVLNGLPENTTKNDNTISALAAPVSAQFAAMVNLGKVFYRAPRYLSFLKNPAGHLK